MQVTSTCLRLYKNYITLFYNVIFFFFDISCENINAILNIESIWTGDFLKLNTSLTSTTVIHLQRYASDWTSLTSYPFSYETALDPYSLWGSHFSDNLSLRLVCSSSLLRFWTKRVSPFVRWSNQSLIFVISSCDCKQFIYHLYQLSLELTCNL